jgi:hypothetical protein
VPGRTPSDLDKPDYHLCRYPHSAPGRVLRSRRRSPGSSPPPPGPDPAVHPQRQNCGQALPAALVDRVWPSLATLAVAALTLGVLAVNTPPDPHLRRIRGPDVSPRVHLPQRQRARRRPDPAGRRCLLGVAQAVAMATSAPIVSSGAAAAAVPIRRTRRRWAMCSRHDPAWMTADVAAFLSFRC